MPSELRPCPFCGVSPSMGRADDKGIGGLKGYVVSCKSCWKATSHSTFTENEAIAAWNTRPVEDSLVEALKQYREEHKDPRNDCACVNVLCKSCRDADAALKQAGRE